MCRARKAAKPLSACYFSNPWKGNHRQPYQRVSVADKSFITWATREFHLDSATSYLLRNQLFFFAIVWNSKNEKGLNGTDEKLAFADDGRLVRNSEEKSVNEMSVSVFVSEADKRSRHSAKSNSDLSLDTYCLWLHLKKSNKLAEKSSLNENFELSFVY